MTSKTSRFQRKQLVRAERNYVEAATAHAEAHARFEAASLAFDGQGTPGGREEYLAATRALVVASDAHSVALDWMARCQDRLGVA